MDDIVDDIRVTGTTSGKPGRHQPPTTARVAPSPGQAHPLWPKMAADLGCQQGFSPDSTAPMTMTMTVL